MTIILDILHDQYSIVCQCRFLLSWPPQSHDLNPMEQVWALVNRKLNEYPTPTKGMLQLWEHVQASFHSITLEQCQKFYHSMPNRIQVVLASKGGWAHY